MWGSDQCGPDSGLPWVQGAAPSILLDPAVTTKHSYCSNSQTSCERQHTIKVGCLDNGMQCYGNSNVGDALYLADEAAYMRRSTAYCMR